eukprot:scaffold28879_cov64-Cyclotella_meneghiniana.AAC.4
MGVWSGRRCRGRGCGVGFVVIEGTGKLLSENTGCRVVGWRRLLDWGLVMVVGFANVRIGGGAGIGEASIGAARIGIGVVDARDSRIGAVGVRVAGIGGGSVEVGVGGSTSVSGISVGVGRSGVGIGGGFVGSSVGSGGFVSSGCGGGGFVSSGFGGGGVAGCDGVLIGDGRHGDDVRERRCDEPEAPLPSINGERGEPWAPLPVLNSSNGWRKAEGPLRMVLKRWERVAREGHWRESEKGAVEKGGERTCDVCSGGILA